MRSLKNSSRLTVLTQDLPQKKILVSPKIKFYLRDYVRKSDGKSQIYIRLTQSGMRKRIATGLYLKKSKWNPAKELANKEENDINLILQNYKTRFNNIILEYRLRSKHITLDKLVEEFSSSFSRVDFITFFENQLKKENLKPGTYRKEKSVFTKLKGWKKELLFCDITYEEIQKYTKHLKTVKKNKENTVMSNLKTIKKYIRRAKRHNIEVPIDLEDLQIKQFRSERTNLTITELKKCYDYYFSEFISDNYKLPLGYFLFSCFTGLRVSDIQNLKRDDIIEQFTIRVVKTERLLNISLCEKAKAILKEDKRLFDKKITPEYTNRTLKKIMTALGITTKVSMHVGRHTFAANYCRMGGQIVDLKNLLGHKSIKVTMQYSKIPYDESAKNIDIMDNIFQNEE